jgi:hypothetical protein
MNVLPRGEMSLQAQLGTGAPRPGRTFYIPVDEATCSATFSIPAALLDPADAVSAPDQFRLCIYPRGGDSEQGIEFDLSDLVDWH